MDQAALLRRLGQASTPRQPPSPMDSPENPEEVEQWLNEDEPANNLSLDDERADQNSPKSRRQRQQAEKDPLRAFPGGPPNQTHSNHSGQARVGGRISRPSHHEAPVFGTQGGFRMAGMGMATPRGLALVTLYAGLMRQCGARTAAGFYRWGRAVRRRKGDRRVAFTAALRRWRQIVAVPALNLPPVEMLWEMKRHMQQRRIARAFQRWKRDAAFQVRSARVVGGGCLNPNP